LSVNGVVVVTAGSAATLLVGTSASIVISACLAGSTPLEGSWGSTWSVAIGSFWSKVIRATLRIGVPVVRPALARTV
jgi:hypothetical protein